MLVRMDQWSERSHWMPEPDEWFPGRVFWGIFIWNFPILLVALSLIGFMLYRTDQESFTGINWMVELALGALTLATTIDLVGCLYLRRLWNKRARRLVRPV